MRAFILYCDCAVTYNGRASSKLARGNYLIVHKPDRSLAVHGANAKVLNYQNAGSKIALKQITDGSMAALLTSINRKEVLEIAIYQIHHYFEPPEWTVGQITIERTERDLVNIICQNLIVYLPLVKPKLVETEVKTPHGNIDILITDLTGLLHVIEVKRHKINLSACSQVRRYGSYFRSQGIQTREYVAAPEISKNAVAYCHEHDQFWFRADFSNVEVATLWPKV